MLNQISFKIKRHLLTRIIIFIVFLLSFKNTVIARDSIDISGGIGLPELLNIGFRFKYNQSQFGINIGFVPLNDESITSISGNYYYHFGGHSKFSDIRPWYWRVGLNYLRDEIDDRSDKYLYLNCRLGRDFNLSKKIGIIIDAGAMFELYYKQEIINIWAYSSANTPKILPSFGIELFYRI